MDECGNKPAAAQQRVELSMKDLEAILEHAQAALSQEEFATLKGALETLEFLTRELEKKSVSVQRLKQWLFGATTETTAKVIAKILERAATDKPPAAEGTEAGPATKPRGHGRNGAAAYDGARTVQVPLATLRAGDACPNCTKGRVYASCEPGLIVRLTGQAPIGGVVYELQKLRCSLCGEVFSAEPPPGVGQDKYDAECVLSADLKKPTNPRGGAVAASWREGMERAQWVVGAKAWRQAAGRRVHPAGRRVHPEGRLEADSSVRR